MAEVAQPDLYVDQVPGFIKSQAEAPAEPKEVAEAATPEVAPEEEKKEKPEETSGKDREEKQSQRRFERRIDRLHRQAAEERARRESLEREIADIKAKNAPQMPQGRPKVEDFQSIEDFDKALEEFHSKRAKEEFERQQNETRQQESVRKLTESWETQVNRAASKYDDFDEVVGELKPTTPWAVALMGEENGDEVAYYLGKHQKEAQKIFGLDPVAQIREIGKLSLKLSMKPEEPKKPSKAPAPIAPVSGTAESPSLEIKPSMTPDEYAKVRARLFPRN